MRTAEIDNSVVEDFSSGKMEAYSIVYNYYREIVLCNIQKIIFQQDIAEDILQDVFIKLWDNKHKFSDKQSIASWLFRVSYNSSISYIRNSLKEKSYSREMAAQNSGEIHSEEEGFKVDYLKQELLQEAIALLPARKRQVFELCKIQGKTYAEAGLILGIASSTVKEYIIEAIQFIKMHVRTKFSQSTIAVILYMLIEAL